MSVLTWLSCSAAPFDRTWTAKQPDGRAIQIHGWGDEFSANQEVDGYTVVFDKANNSYFYAHRTADGRLESSGLLAGRDNPTTSSLKKHLRPDPAARQAERLERYKHWDKVTRNSARWKARKDRTSLLLSPSLSPVPSITDIAYAPPQTTTLGNKVGLCMLVDFPDDTETISQQEVDAFCNGDNYTGFGNNGSVKEYFWDVSNQRLRYTNVVTVYLRMPHPKTYYNDTSIPFGVRASELMITAITMLKALPNYQTEIWPLIQTLTLDNGEVVACNVYYAGFRQEIWAEGLWPHSGGLDYPVSLGSGISVQRYQMTDMGNALQLGTFCHENGHMLCDYPDIYDYEYDSSGGAGGFCLMNSGGHGTNPVKPCAYLRMHSGWLDPVDLETVPDYVLTLTTTNTTIYKYTKPSVTTEYYLFENRQKTGRDALIPGNGIEIWHCDELGDKDEQSYAYNTENLNYEVQLMQADNLWDLNKNLNDGEQEDLYYSWNPSPGYENEFTDESAPSARWWDGSFSDLFVGGFSVPGESMTISLIRPPEKITSQSPLPEGRVGNPYSFQFTTAANRPGTVWSVVNEAALPPGLTFSSSGLLSGLPTVAGTNFFDVVVQGPSPLTATNTFELVILPAYTAPYAEGFNGVMEGPLTGWMQESVSNTIPWRTRVGSPVGRPAQSFEGDKNAYLGVFTDSGSASLPFHITRLISPMIQFGPEAREARISFAYYLENRLTYLQDSFKIYYKTAWSNEWIGPLATYSATDPMWIETSVTLPEAAAGKGIYFAIEGYALGGHGISLDALQINDPVPPLQIVNESPLPVAICGTNYTLATPHVTLQAVGGYTNGLGQTSYAFAVVGGALPSGFTLTLGGLIIGQWPDPVPLTSFDVEVTDLVSGAKATNTLAFAVEYPRAPILQEDFETLNAQLPAGWTMEYVASQVDWRIEGPGGKDGYSPPLSAQSGSHYAFFFGTPSVGVYLCTKLVSPVFDLTQMPNNSRLVFWHFMQKWTGQDQLRIYYRNVTGGPWTKLATYTNNVTSWTQRVVDLPSPSRTYQIAFEGFARSGYGVCVDNVSITDDASAPIILTRDTLPSGFDNFSYQTRLEAVGGVSPYHWSVVSNSLPRGLVLDPNTGVISGIPVGSTQTVFRVAVTGLDNRASTNTFYLSILPPGFIPYVEPFSSTNLPSGWQQTVLSGAAVWKAVQGTYSTVYTSPERYPNKAVSATNNLCLWGQVGTYQTAELITTPFDLGGCIDTAVSFSLCMKPYLGYQDWLTVSYRSHEDGAWIPLAVYDTKYFSASNAVLFLTWTNITLALPEPSATYKLKFEGTVRGGWGICVDDLVVLGERTAPPLVITTPDPLPEGTNGVVYPDFTLEATGGTLLPYSWRIVTSDIFPPGLTLNPTNGIISGTPTQYGIYTFGVTVQDANNVTTTQQYTLQILSGGLTPFETWKSLYFPTLGSYLGDAADQSGDGIPNLIKYGMGLNPTNLNTGTYILGGLTNVVGAPPIADGNYLYFVYRRSLTATDLDFFVKGKTNLADVAELWTTNNIVQVTPWTVGETGVWSWVTNLHTTPMTNAPQRFLRLEVQLQ